MIFPPSVEGMLVAVTAPLPLPTSSLTVTSALPRPRTKSKGMALAISASVQTKPGPSAVEAVWTVLAATGWPRLSAALATWVLPGPPTANEVASTAPVVAAAVVRMRRRIRSSGAQLGQRVGSTTPRMQAVAVHVDDARCSA